MIIAAPAAAAFLRASRSFARLPEMSPTAGFSCAKASDNLSGMRHSLYLKDYCTAGAGTGWTDGATAGDGATIAGAADGVSLMIVSTGAGCGATGAAGASAAAGGSAGSWLAASMLAGGTFTRVV